MQAGFDEFFSCKVCKETAFPCNPDQVCLSRNAGGPAELRVRVPTELLRFRTEEAADLVNAEFAEAETRRRG